MAKSYLFSYQESHWGVVNIFAIGNLIYHSIVRI